MLLKETDVEGISFSTRRTGEPMPKSSARWLTGMSTGTPIRTYERRGGFSSISCSVNLGSSHVSIVSWSLLLVVRSVVVKWTFPSLAVCHWSIRLWSRERNASNSMNPLSVGEVSLIM